MSRSTRDTAFAKKSFGQNFLSDESIIRRIVKAVDPSPEDTLVEIGAGRGALTDKLLENAGKVIAIELDRDLIPGLQDRFDGRPNFTLIKDDALKIDFAGLAGTDGRIKLVANLPYYISTAILQHLIDHRAIFSEMVLMFQREVVERITAKPGDSERGFLTVIVEAYLDVAKLFDVPPSAFQPSPKVWSSVVRIVPKDNIVNDEAALRSVVSAAFGQKRKTILNNLKNRYSNAAEILEESGIDPKQRPEALLPEDWLMLTAAICARGKST